jgi:hypothetical protein
MGVIGVTDVEPQAGESMPDDEDASYFLKTSWKNDDDDDDDDDDFVDWEAGRGLNDGRRALMPFMGCGEPLRVGGGWK